MQGTLKSRVVTEKNQSSSCYLVVESCLFPVRINKLKSTICIKNPSVVDTVFFHLKAVLIAINTDNFLVILGIQRMYSIKIS